MSQRPDRGSLLVSAGALAGEMAGDPAPVLLDVRWRLAGPPGVDSYRQGHLPGAVSAPAASNVNPDGTFRAADDLAARFAALLPRPDDPGAGNPVGAYCGSGVTAAHEVLALALAGIPAALYVGSWSNWVADPARLVAVGA